MIQCSWTVMSSSIAKTKKVKSVVKTKSGKMAQDEIEEGEIQPKNTKITKTSFNEDDNVVQMEVKGDDFISETEPDTDNDDDSTSDESSDSEPSEAEDDEPSQEGDRSQGSIVEDESEDLSVNIRDGKIKDTSKLSTRHKKRRQSMKEQINDLSSTLTTLKNIMLDKGFFDGNNKPKGTTDRHVDKGNASDGVVPDQTVTGSDMTIYKNAVEFEEQHDQINVDGEISFKLTR